jgi:hypothetical protein
MGVQQQAHLHVLPEVIQRRIKIIGHPHLAGIDSAEIGETVAGWPSFARAHRQRHLDRAGRTIGRELNVHPQAVIVGHGHGPAQYDQRLRLILFLDLRKIVFSAMDIFGPPDLHFYDCLAGGFFARLVLVKVADILASPVKGQRPLP